MGSYRDVPIDAEARLADTRQKACGVEWPLPVDAKLDELVREANDAGGNTTRKELAAAVLSDFKMSGDDLVSLLVRYRRLRVRDISPEDEQDGKVIYKSFGPGRRAK